MLLNCHTYYSYKFGTLSVQQLLDEARQKGHQRVALTDINSTSACIDFIRMAREQQLEPVAGIDFRNGAACCYIGLARNPEGFRELNEHLSVHAHAGMPFSNRAPEMNQAYIIYPWTADTPQLLRENEFVGIRPHQLVQLQFSPWRQRLSKLVLLAPVTFSCKKDFNAHRLLRAIDHNTLLSKLDVNEQAREDELMYTPEQLQELCLPFPELLENSRRVLNDCHIHFEQGVTRNKKTFTGSHAEDFELIQQECVRGMKYRYGITPPNVLERVQKELYLIRDLGFCAYFLINWDMVNYARSKNYFYVGRGSGANSMVAYLLRITDVDPIELDLYFERFINPYRTTPPDFDIDFSSYERNDVTKYIFDRHGWDKTALVGAYNTFQGRAVIRELGKVFGLTNDDINRLQDARELHQVDEMGRLVMRYYEHIKGFPSHLSVHSSGIIISDAPMNCYSATMLPPKGFPTVHFSMLEAEDMGLNKFDVLGQRGLGKIKDSIDMVYAATGTHLDLHDIKQYKDDPEIKRQLKSGEAIGCFYIESPAMRMLLTKLRADDYLRLVAASSIIRPGVSESGMMHEYILRFHDEARREKARKELPELYHILEETYGVMVYQEDVIKVAHYFAGLTLSEADILRRGMSWKYRERTRFDLVKEKFFSNCREKGYAESTINGIWRQIESFANYAFAKGHSASYAVESYQALYLKTYYPLQYMTATVNNGGGFYRKEVYLHEAKKQGGTIQLPCINNSEGLCRTDGKNIFIGLGFIDSVEWQTVLQIVKERERGGPYKDLRDFMKRVSITVEQLRPFIRIGAFRFTGQSKKALLWDAHFMLSEHKRTTPEANLFEVEAQQFQLPQFWSHELEDAYDELELLGFTVSCTPFDLLEEIPDLPLRAKDLAANHRREVTMLLYHINTKHTSTSGGERMYFATWFDQDGNWVDSVHFPPSAKAFPFRGPGCYVVKGIAVNDYGFMSIEVREMHRLPTRSIEAGSTRLRNTLSYYQQSPLGLS